MSPEKVVGVVLGRPGISNALTSTLEMFLKKQIVSGSYMIVFVSFETLASIFDVDIVLG